MPGKGPPSKAAEISHFIADAREENRCSKRKSSTLESNFGSMTKLINGLLLGI